MFSWRDLLRIVYVFNLHPRMLTLDGYTISGKYLIKGESHLVKPGIRRFKFDKHYVISYIITKIIKALSITDYEVLESLTKQAWNEYVQAQKTD
jgi:hypothetical protein